MQQVLFFDDQPARVQHRDQPPLELGIVEREQFDRIVIDAPADRVDHPGRRLRMGGGHHQHADQHRQERGDEHQAIEETAHEAREGGADLLAERGLATKDVGEQELDQAQDQRQAAAPRARTAARLRLHLVQKARVHQRPLHNVDLRYLFRPCHRRRRCGVARSSQRVRRGEAGTNPAPGLLSA